MTPTGFGLQHRPRTTGHGGGVAVLEKSSITTSVEEKTFTSFESMEVTCRSSRGHLRLVVFYRPPSNSIPDFLDEFLGYMDSLINTTGRLLIVGDFNIHVDSSLDVYGDRLKTLLYSLHLDQHIKQPTHEHGHILDLVITRSDDDLLAQHSVLPPALSDHFPIICKLRAKKQNSIQNTVSFRKLKHIDVHSFVKDLTESDLCKYPSDEINILVQQYNSTLSAILDKHAPIITKTITIRPYSPWFNDDIKLAKTERRRLERRWRKSKSSVDLERYKVSYRRVMELCLEAKTAYFKNKINACSGDQKAIFKISDNLLFRKKNNILPTFSDPKELANDFSDFFKQKINKIQNELQSSRQHDNASFHDQTKDIPPLNDLQPVSEEEMKEIVLKSKSKSCSLDPIPTTLLKSCLDVLLPILCKITNLSMSSSCVPFCFKQDIVTPLLKKPSLEREDMQSYRPVSNLPYVSKLVEKVVMKRMNDHLELHNLCEPLQSAYRAHHSTETAMVKVMNDILLSIDSKKCVLLVLLDLSAAFDTIDHTVLMQRLTTSFGITGQALDWLHSYFSNRTQSVIISGHSSSPVPLTTGVPQGSVAGPALFPRYSQPIASLVRKHDVELHLYADDTRLYIGCNINDSLETKAQLEKCIEEVRMWMSANLLKLNDSKTEFMVLGSRFTLPQVPDELKSLTVGNSQVAAQTSARNIGVVFDPQLSMEKHVAKITRICYMALRDIGKIRRYLNEDTTKQLILALVMSRLDTNNAILVNLPSQKTLSKLQKVQNSSARLIFGLHKYSSTESIRRDNLHWLPVKHRVDYKINLLTYKCLHNLAPSYLSDLLHMREPPRETRSASKLLLNNPKGRTQIGDRAFSVCAPQLFNKLPESLKTIPTLTTFKKDLKTYHFEIAFKLNRTIV